MKAELEGMGKVIETDVLVIGGGIAGAMAAIAARDYPIRVTLVDKSSFGRSGCASVASGVWHCYLPGDDFELWYKEYVESGMPLVDQKLLKKHILESAKIVHKLDQWGVKWVKDAKGNFARSKATGDSVPRNAMLAEGGPQMMLAIRKEALRRGVIAINKVMVTNLLTSDGKYPTRGKVIGAIGLGVNTGEVYIFKAKATILACGGIKGLAYAKAGQTSMMPKNLTGDGYAMAYRVGAELMNVDLFFGGNSLIIKGFSCAPSMNLLLGSGAKFTNGLGERFMEKYDPVRKESAHRWLTCLAVAKEYKEGKGPVTLDCTHMTAEQIKLAKDVVPIIMETLEKGGVDVTKQKIVYETEYTNAIHGIGGVKTNEEGETSIAGLYVAGASTLVTLPHVPLSGSAISGLHTGESAAEHSLIGSIADTGTEVVEQIKRLKADMLAPMDIKDGIKFDEIQEKVANVVREDIGIFLHEERLKKAAEKLAAIGKQMAKVRARDYHELAKVISIGNLVKVLELAVLAARRRTESRESFVREDYPDTDNINWLKCILLRREDDKVKFWEEPIPGTGEVPVKREKVRHVVFKA